MKSELGDARRGRRWLGILEAIHWETGLCSHPHPRIRNTEKESECVILSIKQRKRGSFWYSVVISIRSLCREEEGS